MKLPMALAGTANNVEEALEIAAQIGRYPLIIRPAFTCGGAGGGIAYNVDEFKTMVQEGIDASMTNQVRGGTVLIDFAHSLFPWPTSNCSCPRHITEGMATTKHYIC